MKKILSFILALCLLSALVSAAAEGNGAAGREPGLFGRLSRVDGADERLAILEEIAEPVAASFAAEGFTVEVCQAYYEGNRVYAAYRAEGTGFMIQDGLVLESGSYADIIAGEETEQEDGSVAGWKECIVPDEETADSQTFCLVFGQADENRISFTLARHEYGQYLEGASAAETCPAAAELAAGKLDLKGTVRLTSPEQAASWIAWQEGEEDTGTDVIVCWNLYQGGELVSFDLFGASRVIEPDQVVFEVMFPLPDGFDGLSLVPEYGEGGENPEEAILLKPAG